MATTRPTPGSSGRAVPGATAPRTRRLSEKRNERYVDDRPLQERIASVAVNLGRTISPRLRQPQLVSGVLVALLLVLFLGQGQFTRLLGTAGHQAHDIVSAQTVTPTEPQVVVPTIKQTGLGPKHMPVDPFRALVTSSGHVLAPISVHQEALQAAVGTSHSPGKSQHTLPSKRGPTGCSATTVVVHSGDSLWSISASHLATTHFSSVTTAWHALYAANHSTIGANPSLILPGQHLCLPAST